jgi:hypothetical protein
VLTWFLNFSSAGLTLFVVTTVLPGWICQLLPQLLAEGRSLEFSKLPAAKLFTDLALRISRYQAGWPSEFLLQRMQEWLPQFKSGNSDLIGISNEAAYNNMARNVGCSVKERRLHIVCTPEKTSVTDRTLYEFTSRSVRDIFHFVKVYEEVRDIGAWEYRGPDGLKYARPYVDVVKVEAKPFATEGINGDNEHAEPDSGAQAPSSASTDVSELPPAVTNGGDVHPAEDEGWLPTQTVLVTIVSLHQPIPRQNKASEVFELAITYDRAPLSDDTTNVFSFEISRPTEHVFFEIEAADDTFIRQPSLSYIHTDEVEYGIAIPFLVDDAHAPKTETANGWTVEMPYPQANSCLVLELDARRF